MLKGFKALIFAFAAAIAICGSVSALQYYPQYWVKGNIVNNTGVAIPALTTFNVYFIDKIKGNYVTVNTDAGKLNYFIDILYTLDPFAAVASTYAMAIQNDPGTNLGTDPIDLPIDGTGLQTLDLPLTKGGGMNLPIDDGMVYHTVITKDTATKDIVLSFRTQGNVLAVNIYKLSGPGVEFSKTGKWTKVNVAPYVVDQPGQPIDTFWKESTNGGADVKVADGKNAYYRIVPFNVNDVADIFGVDKGGLAYNMRTVGKVDINVERNDTGTSFFSFSLPLIPQDKIVFSDVFPPDTFVAVDPALNLLDADQIREWDGTNWISYFKSKTTQTWKNANAVNTDAEVLFSNGYALRLQKTPAGAPKSFYVSTVGLVMPEGQYSSNQAYAGTKSLGLLGKSQFASFGDPYPKNDTFENTFNKNLGDLTPLVSQNKLESDQIRHWDYSTSTWVSSYFNGKNWLLVDTDKPSYPLSLGQGYVFRKADASAKKEFIWKY